MVGDRDRRPNTGDGIPLHQRVRHRGVRPVLPGRGIRADLRHQHRGNPARRRRSRRLPRTAPSRPMGQHRRPPTATPSPKRLKYIEIGNEERTNAHYIDRFKPYTMRCVLETPVSSTSSGPGGNTRIRFRGGLSRTSGTRLRSGTFTWAGTIRSEGAKVDETITRMRKLVQEWSPGTKLKACILEENGGHGTTCARLGPRGHPERRPAPRRLHPDRLPGNCLQPWKQNDNGWDQGQLFFTSGQVWGMPPYYSQQMAAAAHLPCRLEAKVESPKQRPRPDGHP